MSERRKIIFQTSLSLPLLNAATVFFADRELTKRFEFHFTPEKASWLNMAETEFSALSRQCLARRIPDLETLSRELESTVRERNKSAVKFKWQFTVESARKKLSRHYEKVTLKTNVT